MKNILCIVDPESKLSIYQQPAVVRGEFLAKCFNARLHLQALVYNEYLVDKLYHDADQVKQQQSDYIANLQLGFNDASEKLIANGVEVKCDVLWSHSHSETALNKAEQINADLIIKASPYHPHLNWPCFSTNDWRLISQSLIPVLLVRSENIQTGQPVIAAVDPTHEHDKPAVLDHAIMEMAQKMATATHSELHVFHSYYDSSSFLGPTCNVNYLPDYTGNYANQAKLLREKRLADFLASYSLDLNNVHLQLGSVKDQLQQLTEQLQAGLVVMGAVSKSQWKRLFIGLTAEKVLNTLTCDVLVIKANPAQPDDQSFRR